MFGHNDSDDNQQNDNQPVHDGGIAPMHDPSQTPPVVQNSQYGDVPPVPTLSANPISGVQPAPSTPVDAPNDAGGDLLDIKQKALQQLSPLINHLEQTPEEKFRTTMMMIQASDDKKLLPAAYEAAQAITDEKAKAQALLDVVNEINYFTQTN